MKLPEAVAAGIQAHVGSVEGVDEVGGGCISSARRVTIGGEAFFLKYDRGKPEDFFAVEADGLRQLRLAGDRIRVPAVAAQHEDPGGYGWLLLEWLEPITPPATAEADLGAALAQLHQTRGPAWGWHRDGYIGSLPQSNRVQNDWPTFWWEERLEPQLDRALAAGLNEWGWDDLRVRLDVLLAPAGAEGPSLLHGDLWSGNVLFTGAGAAIIDPACYHGHREVDLAMAELFGGFGRDFYRAYLDVWPLAPGWEIRRQIYQLYYLLVHVNLFGAGYVSRTESTLRSVLAA
ncbi:MAG TPA: fructosamine kinase family protein [Longimicrobiaceae bacterium]|nr:fructosamine kinase family protein [Longimicrobiaceae bacterium]